jgi:hypothetical protein
MKETIKKALDPTLEKEKMPLIDTHRKLHKAKGGTYNDLTNVELLEPRKHMEKHGTLKERPEWLDMLKSLMDAREQMRKQFNSCNNRLLAMKRRTDNLDETTVDFLLDQAAQTKSAIGKLDRKIRKHLLTDSPDIALAALKIKGLGEVTIAYMLVYIDIEKARYASSLWSYVGLDKPSHKRYEKNVSGGGNKTLRTVLYAMAESFIKSRNVYRDIYDRTKEDLEVSEKIVESRNTQGKLIECAWKDTKACHRHGAAIRKMIKHFLADFWFVWRKVEGLETPMLYPEAKLGHKGIVMPKERGWVY